MRLLPVLTLPLILSACMLGPDYERPDVPLSDEWHVDAKHREVSNPSLADQAWIDLFRDEQLQNVLRQALANNKNMLIALQRVEEARALYTVNRSALFPTLDLDLRGERENESGLTNDAPEYSNEFFFGPSVSWELDLWGKNRRANNAAYARYLASEYGANAVRLSLIADTATAYFSLEGINSRLKVNYNTLDSREQALVIAEKRFTGGLTSKLEVKQAEVELATSRASVPKVEQSKLVAENAVSVLMGLPPQHLTLENSLAEQYIPPTVVADLPSTLLERRPDILQAEQNLVAASESVGVATARLFPSIALTGDLGFETEEFRDLTDSDGKFWIVEVDLVMPLFNAGARRAELSAAEARFNIARLAYEQRVITALQEASNALNGFHKAGETLLAELALLKASEEYLALATKRYRNGVLAYIDVLDAQRSLFDAQIAVSVAREVQLFALVQLYKALGGGWEPTSVPTEG